MSIRIGIMGYGNLGKGIECAAAANPDIELKYIFTRRDPASISPLTEGVKVLSADMCEKMQGEIDVLMLCGGSATDLPVQTPRYAKLFNVVDSFDTHARIPEHYEAVNAAALEGGNTALISGGWDPGMFSLARLYSEAILPTGGTYTFWGKGVSQGHSDAIRRIESVVDARQYTVPVEETVDEVRRGEGKAYTARQMHKRECFVVAAEGADKAKIEETIVNMPNYFADYDTTVHFISKEELERDHSGLPHGGFVIRSGKTGINSEHSAVIQYSLDLGSNPEFTSSVLVALARAVYRMNSEGMKGCKTILDVPPAMLSATSGEELRKKLL